MPELKFDGGISLGNIVSWLVMVIGLSVSWGIMSSRMEQGASDIAKLQVDLSTARAAISTLQISDARNTERYDSLSRSMSEVKAELRETNDLLRQLMHSKKP